MMADLSQGGIRGAKNMPPVELATGLGGDLST